MCFDLELDVCDAANCPSRVLAGERRCWAGGGGGHRQGLRARVVFMLFRGEHSSAPALAQQRARRRYGRGDQKTKPAGSG